MTIYSITLFADTDGPIYGDDGYEINFCGAYAVACDPAGEPEIVAALDAANCGLFLDEDGATMRAFFTDDEVETMAERAQRETGCFAVIREREMEATR